MRCPAFVILALAILMIDFSPRWAAAQFGGGTRRNPAELPDSDESKGMVQLSLWVLTLSPASSKDSSDDDAAKLPERVANLSGNLGPIGGLRQLLERLKSAGFVQSCREHQLSALDLQPVHVQIGANKPQITATSVTNSGRRTSSVTMQAVGTSIEAQTRIASDGKIVVRLEYSASEISNAPNTEGVSAEERTSVPGAVVSQELTTTVRLKNGTAEVLQRDLSSAGADNGSGSTLKLIILGAQLLPAKESVEE